MSDRWLASIRDPHPWAAPNPLPPPVRTERAIVRPYLKGDGPALYEAVSQNRESLLPWMAWASSDHQDVDDSIHYVERQVRAYAQPDHLDFPLAIFDREEEVLLGGTGLHRIIASRRQAEIGYWIRGDRQGQGICTEVIGTLVTAAFQPIEEGGWGFRRIEIFNAARNHASQRVCEKLGLRLECHMRAERYLELDGYPDADGYQDTYGFGILSHEWDFRAHRALPGIGW